LEPSASDAGESRGPTSDAEASAAVAAQDPEAPSVDASVQAVASAGETAVKPDRSACTARTDNPMCEASFATKVECPASFSEVAIGSYCGIQGRTQPPKECVYLEGRCACAHTSYCGGAYPSLLQQTGMQWSCRPLRAPSDCPDNAAPNGRCSVKGQQCSYGGCGVLTSCSCVAGRYQCHTEQRSSPPSAPPR
jgi:hypothetical protein